MIQAIPFHFLISKGGVAYVNIDGCTSGDIFDGQASPALKSSVIEALKSTPYTKINRYDPYPENKDEDTKEKEILDSESTYYDYWKRKLIPQVIMKLFHFVLRH